MLRRLLITLALLCGGVAFLLTVWIVVPAPHYRLWLVAVGASEWSLWLGALGSAGACFGLLARFAGVRRGLTSLALALGVVSILLSLVPPLTAWREARSHNLQLSLRRYVFGSATGASTDLAPQTFTYSTQDSRDLKLDAYLPAEKRTRPSPVVIIVHGGAWSAGARSDFPRWDWWLVGQGFAVFDVDYRLAPQPNWRTATGDVKCGVGWVRAIAKQLNVDPQRVALVGRSAGAHLALLAAYTAAEPELPPSCTATDTRVQAVVSFYGVTDLAWAYAHPANQRVIDGPETLRRFTGGTPEDAPDIYRLASPTAHVNARTPPTLLIHGGHDQLVRSENLDILKARLEAARVPFDMLHVAYAQHGFDYDFDGWGSQLAQPLIVSFLRTHLAAPE
ncbi:MAG: alpha/beta hydrolase fold domain-containing protein [Pyrinomonadaceae bacterium]